MTVEITFRTLRGGTFKLPFQPSDSVLHVKQAVAKRQEIPDQFAGIRLVYKGRMLPDDATVESASISSAGFVVVMPPKKTIPKAPAPTPTPPPAAAPATQEKATSKPEPAAPASSAPAASSSADLSDPNALVTGEDYNQSVRNIVEMGFPEADVKRALAAAFNNPQRAIDYLFNGIPQTARAEPPAAATQPRAATETTPTDNAAAGENRGRATTTAGQGAGVTPFNMFEAPQQAVGAGGAAGGGGGGSGNLDFLRQLPQFNMMKRLIQANPAFLPQILQQLEESNPNLMALIEANQAEFTRLINEPVSAEDGGGEDVMEQLAQAMAEAGPTGGAGGMAGPGQVVVTEEEHEQIVRLFELGASIGLEESHVVETWLACGRDETAAANYLVDHAEELRAERRQGDDNGNSNTQNPPDAAPGPGGPPA